MDRDKKRKLPARAAARSEQVSKKRSVATPSTERSMTPGDASKESSPAPTPAPAPAQRAPLPTSIANGKPLPTIETPQPEDLSLKDYQSLQESGVVSESLARSRKIWQESLFERYWTKPKSKKKNATGPPDDPSNPPKDSMVRVGHVTIKVEPHVLEATMYTVKQLHQPTVPSVDTSTSQTPQQARFVPTLQYGPPGGELPALVAPQPKEEPTAASTPAPAIEATTGTASAPIPVPETPTPAAITPAISAAPASSTSSPIPTQPRPVLSRPPTTSPGVVTQSPHAPPHSRTPSVHTPHPAPAQPPRSTPAPAPAPIPKPGEKQSDPIISTLAEKASEDPWLRDVMKRVASGSAAPGELAQFQKIIDKIATDYKRKTTPGPPAHTLFVDGRSVAEFADEVNNILAIVLTANPHEKGHTVRVPSTCSPLVESLVRTALDQTNIADMIRRLASKKPANPDSLDLKDELERLFAALPKRAPNGVHSTTSSTPATVRKETPQRPKSDCAGIVFEFNNGDGNRYLFPKFSVLNYVPGGQQVVVSFLIVRRGSQGDGDPTLDYWEPVTTRITGKNLDLLRSVVAPEHEVRQYMDGIKRTMTRAEFVLLAMRLPREEKEKEERPETPKENVAKNPPAVLWAVKAKPQSPAGPSKRPVVDDDRQQAKYQKFVGSVAAKEVEGQ